MKTIFHPFQSLYVRQLVVAVAITGAAAAVAAAAVLSERPAGVDQTTAAPAPVAQDRRDVEAMQTPAGRSPKDAWRRLPPPWASAMPAAAPADASVPAAADVVGGDGDGRGETSPTF